MEKNLSVIFDKLNLQGPNSDFIIQSLNERFPDLLDVNRQITKELDLLSRKNPQFLVDFGRGIIKENEELTTLISKFEKINKQDKSPLDQIESISIYWEISKLLKLPAYIFVNYARAWESFTEPQTIFAQLKKLGLYKGDGEKIRLLRNAQSHRIKFSEDNKGIKTGNDKNIRFSDITKLHLRVEMIFDWWKWAIIINSLSNPRVGLLIALGVYSEINSDKDRYNGYYNSLKNFAPAFFEFTKQSPDRNQDDSKKYISSTVNIGETVIEKYKKIKTAVWKIFYPRKLQLMKEVGEGIITAIVDLINNKLIDLREILLSLKSEINNDMDKGNLQIFIDWLDKNKLGVKPEMERNKNEEQ